MRGISVVLLLFSPFVSLSQGVFQNHTHSVLQEVLSDFPNKFRNIRGALLTDESLSTDYTSTVNIPGALETVITRHQPDEDQEVYSWKSVMAESEDFEVVAARYREVYGNIKNSIIKIGGEKPFILSGRYETPTDEKKFTSTMFYLLPQAGTMKKMKVELLLQHHIVNWKVVLLVYEDQDERVAKE